MFKKFKYAFGLIEVIISSNILAVVLLGAASIQTQSLRVMRNSSLRETAINMVNQFSNFIITMDNTANNDNIINMVSTNQTQAGGCNLSPSATTNFCSRQDLYASLYRGWQNATTATLLLATPSSNLGGTVCTIIDNNNNRFLRIRIRWNNLSGQIESEFIDNIVHPSSLAIDTCS